MEQVGQTERGVELGLRQAWQALVGDRPGRKAVQFGFLADQAAARVSVLSSETRASRCRAGVGPERPANCCKRTGAPG